jgi:hypothetical protein
MAENLVMVMSSGEGGVVPDGQIICLRCYQQK